MTVYACCDQNRRSLVRGTTLNGIDWLDVLDLEAPTQALRQRILNVGFVNSPAPAGLTVDNIAVSGGVRVVGLRVQEVSYDVDVLVVQLNAYGDFSPYVFTLVPTSAVPLNNLDPRLSSITFWFKTECPADLDCQTTPMCPPPAAPAPPINYLAKDYPTFVQSMLDRMSVTAPRWTERSEADIGVTVVETLAYVADRLSYWQDAIATEAYLGTARRRVSMRRHAKLVDYAMHDGCNARVWATLIAKPGVAGTILPGPNTSAFPPVPGTLLLTRVQNDTMVDASMLDVALSASPTGFETMQDLALHAILNQLNFYVWGDGRCSLPVGATSADFAVPPDPANPSKPASLPDLRGRVLLFQEVRSPTTGLAADADPTHRQAVRVVAQSPPAPAAANTDPLTGQAVVTLGWGAADAITFPLCISAIVGETTLSAISVAWGNVVLADHGVSQPLEAIGSMPAPSLQGVSANATGCCSAPALTAIPARFNPSLSRSPLTQQGQVILDNLNFEGEQEAVVTPFDPTAAAASAMQWDITNATPAIALSSAGPSGVVTWSSARDLLESDETATDFVVEVDSDLIARLRFGDGEYGVRPEAGDQFTAAYRVGNGFAGNIGAGALAHVVAAKASPLWSAIQSVSNMSARGGVDPETSESVRQAAPAAFLVQERAVTPADYVTVAKRNADVEKAAADFRWTGSWHTAFVTVDRPGGATVDATFAAGIDDWLERFRVIGHDLQVDGPTLAPLSIDMTVCVGQGYFRSDIQKTLLGLFGDGVNPDGTLSYFNPGRRTFGETLYLSPIYALAQAVPGVQSVEVTKFERLYQPGDDGLRNWQLTFGPDEIARCDSNPNNPEHGVFDLTLRGGQ